MNAEKDEWFNSAPETTKKLKAAGADIPLQSTFREAAREGMDTHTAVIAELRERITAKGAEWSQLSANHSELTNKLSCMKSQNVDDATVLDDLKLAAGNCEHTNKRARVTCQCDESSTTPSTTSFSALLAKQEDFKSLREALMLDTQGILGLATEEKKLRE